MIPLASMIAFLLAAFLLALAPGPDNLFVLSQAVLYGHRAGWLVTLGLCTGLVMHTALVAFGVAALLQVWPPAFAALKGVGALYLLYLAWQAFKNAGRLQTGRNNPPLSARALYRRGIIMNVTNPKVSIFFLAFLPQFAAPERGALVLQLLMLGALFMLMTLLVFGGLAQLAGTLGRRLAHSTRAQRGLNRLAGMVFIALALNLLVAY